mmetsp:Transcript_2350/g.3299  ORF Transcript_2350/g.3299 Transcript_2350/m.3299 type:complete len:239 (+) Transcript_2350:73-789(+)
MSNKKLVSLTWDPISRFFASKLNQITSYIPPPPCSEKKKVLMVIAHPVKQSFIQHLANTAFHSLQDANHEVKQLSLYEESFQPVLTEEELRNYMSDKRPKDVQKSAELLRWCNAIVFVFPTWWYQPPAILKGWMDRVFLPGIAFDVANPENKHLAASNGLVPGLANIKRMGVITTLGADFWTVRRIGEPGRMMFSKGIRPMFHKDCTLNYVCMYEADSADKEKREKFTNTISEVYRYF